MVGGCIIPRRDSHLLQLYAFLQKLILILAEPLLQRHRTPGGSVEPSLRTTGLAIMYKVFLHTKNSISKQKNYKKKKSSQKSTKNYGYSSTSGGVFCTPRQHPHLFVLAYRPPRAF